MLLLLMQFPPFTTLFFRPYVRNQSEEHSSLGYGDVVPFVELGEPEGGEKRKTRTHENKRVWYELVVVGISRNLVVLRFLDRVTS
jgi:hypothetical protein